MKLETAIQYALDNNAILFTGSGFSYGAKNILDHNLISGLNLRDYLAKECGINNTTSSLSSVADYHIKYHKDTQPLIDTLTNLFTVKEVTNSHKNILSVEWKRIYTTNYDDVAEIAATQNNFRYNSVTMSSECNNPAMQKVCVHINGHINKLSHNTLMNEFKLGDLSYDAEQLRGKPWFDFMEKDFISAKAIFIVGFSLSNDIDLSRIMAIPAISKKIVFINKPNMDPIDKNILEKYAPVYEIGIDGFAEQIKAEKKNYVPSPIQETIYESFVHEYMTPASPNNCSLSELTHFYSLGKITNSLFAQDSFGDYKYIVSRKAMNIFLNNINQKKVFLATSTLGNGKTVFCEMVRNELRKKDIDVYTYSKTLVDIDFEISEICSSKKRSVVIIDDYYKHLDILNTFYIYGCSNITFLLTSRQSKLAINYRKLINTLRIEESDIQPLYLYGLVDNEPEEFADVLLNNNLLPSKLNSESRDRIAQYFKNTCRNSLANIVLDLYESSNIKEKLIDLIETATKEEDSAIHDLCILALCSSVMNLELSYSEMLSLLNIDYIYLAYNDSTLLNELFTIESDNIKITSSIISKSLLYSIISPSDLTNVLLRVVNEADKRYNHDKKYQELLKAILSHTNFEPLIKTNSANLDCVEKFYNQIRNNSFCKQNPFYWEQFATICIEANDFITAKQCVESAYSAAKQIYNFTPFQISTIHGDLLLRELKYKLSYSKIVVDTCIDKIKEAHNLFIKYYDHPENNHYHIFSCAQNYLEIYKIIRNDMNKSHFQFFIEKATDIYKKMLSYQKTNESSIYPSTIKWSQAFNHTLDDAKTLILSADKNKHL